MIGLLGLLAFVVRPLMPPQDLRAVADRAYPFTVFVVAHSAEGGVSASGVLVRGGLVLTDLHGLLTRRTDGAIVPAHIAVSIGGFEPMPALLAGADAALGIAVLQLPDVARALPGASIAASDPGVADDLLAMGSNGTTVNVLGVKVDHVGPDALLRTTAELPAAFRGGPLFDVHGDLAALELPSGVAPASSVRRLLGQ